jgi:hypothetical protein
MEQPKRPRGRPPAPPEEVLDERVTIRVNKALKAKVEQYGNTWARRALEKAKPPKVE